MKKLNSLIFIVAVLSFVVINFSCKDKAADFCEDTGCMNGGICFEGACDCPPGFGGISCEEIVVPVQVRLETETPLEIVNSGTLIDSLYGKTYEGGLIFYFNTEDNVGMLAATEDQGSDIHWGISNLDIPNLNNVPFLNNGPPNIDLDLEGARIGDGAANTDAILAEISEEGIAAKVCRNLGEDWFLPSMGELLLMYENLRAKGYGDFSGELYWSSTELNAESVWIQDFSTGLQYAVGVKGTNVNEFPKVRAAKSF